MNEQTGNIIVLMATLAMLPLSAWVAWRERHPLARIGLWLYTAAVAMAAILTAVILLRG